MVSLLKRMRKLKTLLDIRLGPGAALLPSATSSTKFPPVSRLHLTYARKMYEGHIGARQFWRQCLPRLKYYNPGVRMTVKQTEDQAGPALLTVYFNDANAAKGKQAANADQLAPAPEESERTATLDLKNMQWNDIWSKVRDLTGAEEVKATEEEEQELADLTAQREKADIDRKRVAAIRKNKKDQDALLQAARGEVEKLRAG